MYFSAYTHFARPTPLCVGSVYARLGVYIYAYMSVCTRVYVCQCEGTYVGLCKTLCTKVQTAVNTYHPPTSPWTQNEAVHNSLPSSRPSILRASSRVSPILNTLPRLRQESRLY